MSMASPQQPKREGLSRRGLLLMLLLAGLIYLATWISTKPLTRSGSVAGTSVPATARAPGWWCAGSFERINDFIEICITAGK